MTLHILRGFCRNISGQPAENHQTKLKDYVPSPLSTNTLHTNILLKDQQTAEQDVTKSQLAYVKAESTLDTLIPSWKPLEYNTYYKEADITPIVRKRKAAAMDNDSDTDGTDYLSAIVDLIKAQTKYDEQWIKDEQEAFQQRIIQVEQAMKSRRIKLLKHIVVQVTAKMAKDRVRARKREEKVEVRYNKWGKMVKEIENIDENGDEGVDAVAGIERLKEKRAGPIIEGRQDFVNGTSSSHRAEVVEG